VVTRDGVALAITSIRPGDTLIPLSHRVVDASQRTVDLTGIVASAPLSPGDPMILQTTSSHSVVVDIDSRTRVTGGAQFGISRTTIQDADRVRVIGVVDQVLGEMTQTMAVMWLGP